MAQNTTKSNGTKSKERVKQHGEVFTPDNIVIDMLDMVDEKINNQYYKYITTTYLEPSCGNGNFLIRILDNKIKRVTQQYPIENEHKNGDWYYDCDKNNRKNLDDIQKKNREYDLLRAVSTIYGIDIQEDNVKESIERMLELIKTGTVSNILGGKTQEFNSYKFELSPGIEKLIKTILERNIQVGNTLSNIEVSSNSELAKALVNHDINILTEYVVYNDRIKNTYNIELSTYYLQPHKVCGVSYKSLEHQRDNKISIEYGTLTDVVTAIKDNKEIELDELQGFDF